MIPDPVGDRKKKRKRRILLAVYLAVLIVLFEVFSNLILAFLIHPERMKRFDDIYVKENADLWFAPHPYVKFLNKNEYVREKRRVLRNIDEPRENKVFIVMMGGSTTWTGYPAYTKEYLDEKLEAMNSPIRAEVFNFGGAGWTSLQSSQNYFYLLKYLHPDFVVIHHNHNDGDIERALAKSAIVYCPDIGSLDRAIIKTSKFYKLLKYTYISSYNYIVYRKHISCHMIVRGDYPMTARMSSYINDADPGAFMPRFFEKDFLQAEYAKGKWNTLEFMLKETYGHLAKCIKTDNGVFIVTTQYQNYSRTAPKKYDTPVKGVQNKSDRINSIIRDISREYDVPLVDLDKLMLPYDHLLKDECHFQEEGIKVKGELVGATIWEIMLERYNLRKFQTSR